MTIFEQAFASTLGTQYALSFWKGRVALSAILDALDIGAGDEVILPGFTCVVVPNAILYRGARPVYVDIDPDTFNIDPHKIDGLVTPRTRAILVQHTFGCPADLDAVLSLAQKHSLTVIEDCAHALGVKFKGQNLGTIGHAAFFSSQWSKPFSTGLGGVAVTNDSLLGERMADFQKHCVSPGWKEILTLFVQIKLHQLLFTPGRYWLAVDLLHWMSAQGLFIGSSTESEICSEKPEGYEKRMSSVQAGVGLRQLGTLDKIVRHRIEVCQDYHARLSQRGLPAAHWSKDSPVPLLRYPIQVKDKPALLRAARREHIELGDWFVSVLHPVTFHLDRLGYALGQCPIAEDVAAHIINLPTHLRVGDSQVEQVIGFLERMQQKGLV